MSSHPTTTANGPSKKDFERDLLNYSITAQARPANNTPWLAYGAASSVALLASSGVEATIIYSDPQNIEVAPGTSNNSSFFLDLDGGGTDFRFNVFNFDTGSFQYMGAYGGGIFTNGLGAARRFSSGQLIGTPGSSFASVANLNHINLSSWNAGFNSATGFIGVQLGSGNFGWIRVHTSQDPQTLTILDWAYDDSGAQMLAGAGLPMPVPEPRATMLLGMGLLALGASGLRTLRRRKREAGLDQAAV